MSSSFGKRPPAGASLRRGEVPKPPLKKAKEAAPVTLGAKYQQQATPGRGYVSSFAGRTYEFQLQSKGGAVQQQQPGWFTKQAFVPYPTAKLPPPGPPPGRDEVAKVISKGLVSQLSLPPKKAQQLTRAVTKAIGEALPKQLPATRAAALVKRAEGGPPQPSLFIPVGSLAQAVSHAEAAGAPLTQEQMLQELVGLAEACVRNPIIVAHGLTSSGLIRVKGLG